MARPRKDSLDYFPLDAALLSNPKMMMAVNDAGPDAVAVYVAVLGAVYSKSYWLPKDSTDLQVLPARLRMEVERFATRPTTRSSRGGSCPRLRRRATRRRRRARAAPPSRPRECRISTS